MISAGLVRFHPSSNPSQTLIGQPVDDDLDVGLAVRNGQDVHVDVFEGSSVLDPGQSTGRREKIGKLLAPLGQAEVGTVRCIGLNVSSASPFSSSTSLGFPPVDPQSWTYIYLVVLLLLLHRRYDLLRRLHSVVLYHLRSRRAC